MSVTTDGKPALHRARLDIGARSFCLVAGYGLSLVTGTTAEATGVMVLLVAVAGVVSWWAAAEGAGGRAYPMVLVAEATFATTLIASAGARADSYFIYLAAPPLLAGLRRGLTGLLAVTAAETLTLVLLQAQFASHADPLQRGGPWVLTGFAVGLLGAWILQLHLLERDTRLSPYASAHRLLGQLRTIVRDLPGGLDTEVVSENILSTAVAALAGNRAALLVQNESDQPMIVAHRGDDAFISTLASDPLITTSMGVRRAMQQPDPHEQASHGFRVCIPMVVGHRSIGAVVVDGPNAVSDEVLESVQESLYDEALRLESAALFSDVKAMATVEERHRLAREIHDGIAQEIASMGYLVDDLAQDECDQRHQEGLVTVREELTRVVTELRHSIFDLRSGVSSSVGLGSVLGDYVREVGKDSGMTVHLSLEESPRRLRLGVETELLRIAQEAVTNARKHSQAENMWVACRVEPPFAELRIEDDGIGSVAHRTDHFGLHIMKERAARINAVLTIGDRVGGGTVVSAVLLPAEAAAVSTPNGETHALHRFAS
jgi:signal transduction histidine kinase